MTKDAFRLIGTDGTETELPAMRTVEVEQFCS